MGREVQGFLDWFQGLHPPIEVEAKKEARKKKKREAPGSGMEKVLRENWSAKETYFSNLTLLIHIQFRRSYLVIIHLQNIIYQKLFCRFHFLCSIQKKLIQLVVLKDDGGIENFGGKMFFRLKQIKCRFPIFSFHH